MTFETERLTLRPWEQEDAESLYKYASDERVGPAAGWKPHKNTEESKEIIKTVLSAEETYAAVLKETGEPVGSIGLMLGKASNLNLPENEAEIGFWIGAPYWGQGLIPEAVNALIRRAFGELNLERLWCAYFDGNEKSRRCQEKCGFKYHHTNKDAYWALTEEIHTEHITLLEKRYVRPLLSPEIPKALDLIWEVFLKFDASYYTEEGIKTFRANLDDKKRTDSLKWYGAFDKGSLAGILAIGENRHFGAFFVKGEYQGKGYGRMLFETVKKDFDKQEFTVNASPYAVKIYERLGFVPTDKEQTVKGLRFTPMLYRD